MPKQKTTDVSVAEGNHFTIELTVFDRKAKLDLTGSTVEFMVKDVDGNGKIVDADASNIITKSSTVGAEITITDATNGVIQVFLLPDDTRGLGRAPAYKYDIKVKDTGSNQYNTGLANFFILDVVNFDDIA